MRAVDVIRGYFELLYRFTPGSPPWAAATEFLPWLFRWIAFLLVLPVLILLGADAFTYLYFRAVYQPWGRARTAFYKFPHRWGSRPGSRAVSPHITATELPDPIFPPASGSDDHSQRLSPDDATASPMSRRRMASINYARGGNMGMGMDGPIFEPHSPTMESGIPLPEEDEDESAWFGIQ